MVGCRRRFESLTRRVRGPLSSPSHTMNARFYLKVSIAVALATMALKGGAWWLTGSVGLLADALESTVNLVCAAFALAMVTIARRPPDKEHPFGHHKAEYFASGFEGALIAVAGLAILWEAAHRFVDPQALAALDWGISLTLLSSLLNAGLGGAMLRAARQERSMALEAEAQHLFTDVWTSAAVIVGLVAVRFTGWVWIDAAIGVAVGIHVVRGGALLAARSVNGLMDHAVGADVQADIERTLDTFRDPSIRVDHVATRDAGQRRFLHLHLHVPADWTLSRAASFRHAVEQDLMRAVPDLHATIELLPSDVEPLEPLNSSNEAAAAHERVEHPERIVRDVSCAVQLHGRSCAPLDTQRERP